MQLERQAHEDERYKSHLAHKHNVRIDSFESAQKIIDENLAKNKALENEKKKNARMHEQLRELQTYARENAEFFAKVGINERQIEELKRVKQLNGFNKREIAKRGINEQKYN